MTVVYVFGKDMSMHYYCYNNYCCC